MQWSINTPALYSKPYWLLCRPSRKSSRGLVRVYMFVCSHRWVWIHFFVCVDLWVWLSMPKSLRMCIYVLSGRHLFQLAAGLYHLRMPTALLCSTNLDLILGWPQITGAHFYESDMSSHSIPGRRNASTHKVLWGNTPDLLINMSSLAFLERGDLRSCHVLCQKTASFLSFFFFSRPWGLFEWNPMCLCLSLVFPHFHICLIAKLLLIGCLRKDSLCEISRSFLSWDVIIDTDSTNGNYGYGCIAK